MQQECLSCSPNSGISITPNLVGKKSLQQNLSLLSYLYIKDTYLCISLCICLSHSLSTHTHTNTHSYCCCCYLVTESCPSLLWPHWLWPWWDCSPPGSSVLGISQARILEWVAVSFSRVYSWPRDRIQVCSIAGRFFTSEPPGKNFIYPHVYIHLKAYFCNIFPDPSLNSLLPELYIIFFLKII